MKTQLLLTLAVLGAPIFSSQTAFAAESEKKTESTKNPLDLIPDQLTNAKGEKVSKDALKGKVVGLYFSAHWCPPCRAFTPKLVKFRDINAAEFEVVFVSSDKDADAMKGYMEETKMQWTAIPFKNSKSNTALSKHFGVSGIPALIILGPDGKVITKDGRGDVSGNPDKALSEWKKQVTKS